MKTLKDEDIDTIIYNINLALSELIKARKELLELRNELEKQSPSFRILKRDN